MTPNSPRSLATYILTELLNISAALGTLKEHDRITETRLTSMEARFDTLTLTLMRSGPSPHCQSPTPTTPTSPSPTDTSRPQSMATGTGMDTPSLITRTVSKLGREAVKDVLIWIAGKLGLGLLSWVSPTLLVLGAAAWKWSGLLWRLVTG